jgi:hypothetical protein
VLLLVVVLVVVVVVDLFVISRLGARPRTTHLEWDAQLLEFIAIGTGVVHGEGHKGFRAHDGGPFSSDLSGQDFCPLLHAAYRFPGCLALRRDPNADTFPQPPTRLRLHQQQ